MKSGKSFAVLSIDKKGRIHLPQAIRKELKLEDQVLAEKKKHQLIIKPVTQIKDPLTFLSSFSIKTKKTPVEMKKEAEKVFGE